MSVTEVKYGITISDTRICEKNDRNAEVILEEGKLFQILNENGYEKYIKLYTHDNKHLLASAEIYCITDKYVIIEETLWNMLLAIRGEFFRIKVIQNYKFRNFLMNLKVGYEININGKTLGKFGETIPCEIRYIGPIPEIAPGIFFGFKTVSANDKIIRLTRLVDRYCKCDLNRGFIRSAEALMNSGSLLRAKAEQEKFNEPIHIKGLKFIPAARPRSRSLSNIQQLNGFQYIRPSATRYDEESF